MKPFISWVKHIRTADLIALAILSVVFCILALLAGAFDADARTMYLHRAHTLTHAQEMRITLQVAREYKLSKDQAILLLAIRQHEHGRAGKEFGVECTRAMRYHDGIKSFRVQARWAAGSRGIKVCEAWHDPMVFINWALGNGYRDDLTIDRFPDNNGNYEPGNCRWATMKEQNNNTRKNIKYNVK